MSIIDRIRERFTKRQEKDRAVALLPSQMNRAGRRKMGWRGRLDPEWVQHESSYFVPRYIRRRFGPLSESNLTRRARKVRARTDRLVARYGMEK